MHKLEYSYKYSHNFPAAAPAVSVANNSLDHHLLQRIITANAVVIFSRSTCCMCHAVKHLFCGMGVHPTVYELDEDNPRSEKELEKALMRLLTAGGGSAAVPVVFIGGKLVGGMDRVMGSHINGSLVPLLKQVGALWL